MWNTRESLGKLEKAVGTLVCVFPQHFSYSQTLSRFCNPSTIDKTGHVTEYSSAKTGWGIWSDIPRFYKPRVFQKIFEG